MEKSMGRWLWEALKEFTDFIIEMDQRSLEVVREGLGLIYQDIRSLFNPPEV